MSRVNLLFFLLGGHSVDAVILSIGTELLDGHLTDTNATFLAQELAALSVSLRWVAQVGDEEEWIVRLLQRAWQDARLILTTGGIGPTQDDLTREAIAQLLNEPLSIDPTLVEQIRQFFAARGLTMPEQNVKQASRIPSCELLPNPIGTAPGWFVQRDGHIIVVMPGVPREMMRMWREQAVPRLLPQLGGGVIRFRTLKTIGLGESLVEQRLQPLIARGQPRIATYAKDDGVHVRITARGSHSEEVEHLLMETEKAIRQDLGWHVYGSDETTLGAAILAPLQQAGWTLSVVEQGSGGRLVGFLLEEPLASELVREVVVLPENTHDPRDPVTQAQELARQALARTQAHCAFVTVVRIQSTESIDRNEGSIALLGTTPTGTEYRTHRLISHPQEIRRRAGLWAAEFLRQLLERAPASVPGSSATSVADHTDASAK